MSDWNVVAYMKIMPEDVETPLDPIKERIKKLPKEVCELHSMEEKPIAFGLKALEARLLFNDKKGGMEDIQQQIQSWEGVAEVEVADLNRL
ncbi:MAG: elongation factor 1-beta [Candidatus Altiarchaeales archaeon]|nr:elongation factor 1-beta [Candidatus Altiarchaeales archaeon]